MTMLATFLWVDHGADAETTGSESVDLQCDPSIVNDCSDYRGVLVLGVNLHCKGVLGTF